MPMSLPEFRPFAKTARWSRDIVITEKIDGTNAQITITPQGDVLAGSRNQWISVDADNHGFAAWVESHKQQLLSLGTGTHFGEWWGSGINRRYGMSVKKFSLFNTSRWQDPHARPACCDVVPVLYSGIMDAQAIDACLAALATSGSVAAPGFMKPEGIMIFHTAANMLFKKTLEKDEAPKGMH